jgi:hypothetical protein
MGLNVERSLKTIFPTQLKKIITHPSSCVFGIAPLLVMLKEHLYPLGLHVQSHKITQFGYGMRKILSPSTTIMSPW